MRLRPITGEPVRHAPPSILGPATGQGKRPLRILFLVSAHNGLSQRAWIALRELGHEVTVAVVDSAAAMEAAVDRARSGADRVPVSEDADSRVDLAPARRAWSCTRDRPATGGLHRWTGRSNSGPPTGE